MKIAVHCNHIDHGGGGTYSHFLIRELEKHGDVYITHEHPDFVSYWGDRLDLPRWRSADKPDLFVCIDHRGDIQPIGRKNLRVIFYPFAEMEFARRYDAAIVMNPFMGRAVVKTLGLYPYIVPIGLDPNRFQLGLHKDKENVLLVVANFFKESDGHSKHQDKIIEWFKGNGLQIAWRLVFVGGGQEDYFRYCQSLASEIPQIRFVGQQDMAQVAKQYPSAKFLIHANGYGRSDPAQTEHFGIVAIEAMLSGVQPIVHNSGGCREIEGVWTWDNWDDLTHLIQRATNPVQLREFGKAYNPERMAQAVGECLRGVMVDE